MHDGPLEPPPHVPGLIGCVVVVYQYSISNVKVTGEIEALLYSKVHAVLEC